MEETAGDSDRMLLLSLPAVKQLSPWNDMNFWVEVQENCDENFYTLQLQIPTCHIPEFAIRSPFIINIVTIFKIVCIIRLQ
jgi:hypothetical protein